MALFSFSGLSNEKLVDLTSLSNASYTGESPPSGWSTLTGATLGFVEGFGTGTYSGTTYQGSSLWFGAPAARVYKSGSEITVSFRGTDTSVDYATYLDIIGNNNYINAFSSFLDSVAGYVSNPINAISSINVVGHSLGAAAANILRNVSSTQNGGIFDNATYLTVATPKVSSNPDILNIGFENDWVYKAIARTTPFTADDFFSTTDNIVLYDDAYSANDWPGFAFGPSDTSAHSRIGYVEVVKRITKSSFYDEMNRDSVVIVVATDSQVSDKYVSTSDHFGSDAYFVGRDRADDILGGPGIDKIDALDGNDTVEGRAGNDVIKGGDGEDVAVFRGDCLEYDIFRNNDGSITVSHERVSLFGFGADDGTDTLSDVEIARFSDGKELDLTASEIYGCTELGFIQDFVTGTTQDTQVVFDLTREGDTSYDVEVFVDGRVTTGNAVFNDFFYTIPAGENPSLTITASVAEVFGDVAFDFEISIDVVSPLEQFVMFSDATAGGVLIGDEVDDQGGGWWGDPHLITFDNVAYDFQAEGEFVLSRATSGDDYELQARFVAISSAASVADAMATRIGSTVVSVEIDGADGVLRVNGAETALTDGATITVDSGTVSRDGRNITIDHGNGDITQATVFATFLNATPIPSSARVAGGFEGLFGNDNGTPADDFRLADGTVLTTPVPIETLYGDFAASWSVDASDRILPGTAVAYDAPDRIVTIDSLPADLLAKATAAVDAAGITNELVREAAILDFALTGNLDFIEAAVLTDEKFNPIVDTVPVDPVSNPVVVLTSDNLDLDEEENGAATLTVSRGDTEGDLVVNYTIAGVGAVPASADDFVNGTVSGSVVIADGDESASFVVQAANDNTNEGVETFDVSISLDSNKADSYEVLVSSIRLTIEDNDLNLQPLAFDDGFSLDENQSLLGNVLDDNGNGADSDPDGDPLTVSLVSGPAQGALTLGNDGSFSYDPNGQFEALAAGESATETFTYAISDGNGETDTATATITINGVDDAAIAGNDAFSVSETATVAGNVFDDNGNGPDSDIDSALLVTAVAGLAANVGQQITTAGGGLVTIAQDGTLDYDPNGAFAALGEGDTATDSVTYSVNGVQATVTFTIDGETNIITGDDTDNELSGGSGADIITGGLGADVMEGNGGDDQFQLVADGTYGEYDWTQFETTRYDNDDWVMWTYVDDTNSFSDHIRGGAGTDTVLGTETDDTLMLYPGDLVQTNADAGAYDPRFESIEVFDLDDGNDIVNLQSLIGAYVTDVTLIGGEGNDWLAAGSGDDSLLGGEGNDSLLGGLGADELTGGIGADYFIFSATSADADDVVTDFELGVDTLFFAGFGTEPKASVSITESGGNTTVTVSDTDGDEMAVLLQNVTGVLLDDLVLSSY